MNISAQKITSADHGLKNSMYCCLTGEHYRGYFIRRLKNIVRGFLLLATLLIVFYPAVLPAQDFTRTITKTAEFTDNTADRNKFRIMNINGSVAIEAYEGDKIELTAKEKIQGTNSGIEQAKKELEYKLERRGNLILAYLNAPFVTLKYEGDEIHYNVYRDRENYRFVHDLQIKVPRGILLEGSTINKGTLSVSGSFKNVEVNNVNGPLKLENMTSPTQANTVNGDITAFYDKQPAEDSEYQTVNGSIEIHMPGDLSADIYFKSMHGDLYTDFEDIQHLQPQVNKVANSNHSATTYQVDKSAPIRINKGGPKLHFKVLNGDVYLRKQQ